MDLQHWPVRVKMRGSRRVAAGTMASGDCPGLVQATASLQANSGTVGAAHLCLYQPRDLRQVQLTGAGVVLRTAHRHCACRIVLYGLARATSNMQGGYGDAD